MEAGNGAEALERVRADLPDLVVNDITTPVLDGVELIRRLRADPATARIPILAATADGDLAGSVDAVLPKPYRPDQLTAAVDALLAPKESLT